MRKERIAGLAPAWKIGSAAIALIMLMGLAACGSKKTEQTVTPATTSILGPAGDAFEVIDKPRTLKVDGNRLVVNVGLTRTAEGSVEDLDWGLQLLDDNDEVIVSDEDIWFAEGKETLNGMKVGDEGSLKLPLHERLDDSDLKKITKFKVTSKAKKDYGSASSDATEVVADEVLVDDGVSASSSNEDWDKILDEYEKYCDKAIALAKKAQAGDISAMTDYASLLESAESLQSKLENAGSNLTAAQTARLSKIAAKLAQSAM